MAQPMISRCASRAAVFVSILCASATAQAYPEFQRYIQSHGDRVVSCGMCHVHPDGPDGTKHGQIGSLGQVENQALASARSALSPGPLVDSPILNDFGDYLVSQLGRSKIIAMKAQPAALLDAIDLGHDLDGDGIADVRELRDGTDPTDPRHGDPWLLFLENAHRHWFHLVMLLAATVLGLTGLGRLFSWFAYEARRAADAKSKGD